MYISEIYSSIQGESSFSGFPCVFIRLAGCPLRCKWCDTAYSFKQEAQLSIDAIVAQVKKQKINLVELTGGEPLAQEDSTELMLKLVKNNFKVLLETSGSECLSIVPSAVHIIMDLKCPLSNMSDKNLWSNISLLKKTDEVKFVIAGKDDMDWAISKVKEYNLENVCNLLFSPAFALVKPDELCAWFLESKLKNARLQLQIHKYIWNPRKKGV